MSFRQQVNATLDNVPGLTDEERLEVQEIWASGRPPGGAYPDSLLGRTEALSNLQQIAVRYLLTKQNRFAELKVLEKRPK